MIDTSEMNRIVAMMTPPVVDAVAALQMLFFGQRPRWLQIQDLCKIRGSPERPVAAAFGYLIHPSHPDTARFGYTDMLADMEVPGIITYGEDRRIEAAYGYFLLSHPDARNAIVVKCT